MQTEQIILCIPVLWPSLWGKKLLGEKRKLEYWFNLFSLISCILCPMFSNVCPGSVMIKCSLRDFTDVMMIKSPKFVPLLVPQGLITDFECTFKLIHVSLPSKLAQLKQTASQHKSRWNQLSHSSPAAEITQTPPLLATQARAALPSSTETVHLFTLDTLKVISAVAPESVQFNLTSERTRETWTPSHLKKFSLEWNNLTLLNSPFTLSLCTLSIKYSWHVFHCWCV